MKYFTIPELLRSDMAAQYGIDNTPDPIALANLKTLVDVVLDPLRERWGGPIIVTSGYRCPELNRKVGGAGHSFHLRGMAADIYPRRGTATMLYECIQRMFCQRKIGITECYLDEKRGYVHIAHNCEEYNEWPFVES